MVTGYVDCPYLLTLDMSGGKCHLGESTLRGVILEVEEECSLAIDYEYLFSKVSDRYGGGLGPTKTTTNAVVNDDEDAMVRVLTSRGTRCLFRHDTTTPKYHPLQILFRSLYERELTGNFGLF